MPRQTRRVALPRQSPAAVRQVTFHDYGPAEARPKIYIQASIHADEIPGLLVLHHLTGLLDQADAEGAILGRITMAPYANPIGLDQWLTHKHQGRHELAGGGNFNRNWPDYTPQLVERLDGRLGGDADANIATIREAMLQVIEDSEPLTELEALRQTIDREAADADVVIDLHCDEAAVLHAFFLAAHWPDGEAMSRELGCQAVMLADDSGGGCFDEHLGLPWLRLSERFPEATIPPACLATTIELRGQADVSDALAEADAKALFRYFQHRGLIAGEPGPLPEARCEATRLEALEIVRAPFAGVLSYHVELGETVSAGQPVADLIDPAAETPAEGRQTLVAGTDGLIVTLQLHKYVKPGVDVAKIAGSRVLEHRRSGSLVDD